jgi:hypothetical protein
MKYLLILIILLQISCQSIEDKIEKKILLFDIYGDKYFDSMYVRVNRELYNPEVLEYEVRKVKGDFRGFMQTYPEKYWHRNGDTMNVEFIEVFSKFDCWQLYNFENFTFIEFLDRKSRVIMFKGKPNFDNYYIKTLKPTEYKDGWKYITKDIKREN